MLIKNIFSKNSAWVLGFAAAAIFAVTFVACDNSSTSESGGGGARAGQALVWFTVGSETNLLNEDMAGVSLAQDVGGIVSSATPPTGAFYTRGVYDTVEVGEDGKLKVGSAGAVYAYLKVPTAYQAYDSVDVFAFAAVDANGVLKGSLTPGDRYLCVAIDGATIEGAGVIQTATAGGKITVSGASATKLYFVVVICKADGDDSAVTGNYFPGGSTANEVEIASLEKDARYVVTEVPNAYQSGSSDNKISLASATKGSSIFDVKCLTGANTDDGYWAATGANEITLATAALKGKWFSVTPITTGVASVPADTSKIYNVARLGKPDTTNGGKAEAASGTAGYYKGGQAIASTASGDLYFITEATDVVVASSAVLSGVSAGDLVKITAPTVTGVSTSNAATITPYATAGIVPAAGVTVTSGAAYQVKIIARKGAYYAF